MQQAPSSDADEPAPAAAELRPAQRDRGQRDQRVLRESGRLRRAHERRERDAADGGEGSAEAVGEHAHGR